MHERIANLIDRLIGLLTLRLGIEVASYGSTTLLRESKRRGLEPELPFWAPDVRRQWSASVGRWGLAVLARSAFFFVCMAILSSCDEPPPHDQDLLDFRREVPEGSNGFVVLDLELGGEIWPDGNEEIDGRSVQGSSASFDLERAEKLTEEKRLYLEQLDVMLDAADFQSPPDYDLDSRVPYLLQWRGLAFLLESRSRVHEEQGRGSESMDDALKLVRLGRRIEGSQGASLFFLVGIAIQSLGVNRILRIVGADTVSGEDLERCQNELDHLGPHRQCLRDAFRAEYVFLSRTLDRLGRRDLSPYGGDAKKPWVQLICEQPLLLPNETKRLYAGELRDLISSVGKLSKDRKPCGVEAKYGYVRGRMDWILNAHGKLILIKTLPTIEKSLAELDKARVVFGMTRVLLAVRRFQLAAGVLPGSVDDLIPDYLDAIPRDPFHGEPLLYSREKKIIYSLGADGIDSGGSRKEDPKEAEWDLEEPTLGIGF